MCPIFEQFPMFWMIQNDYWLIQGLGVIDDVMRILDLFFGIVYLHQFARNVPSPMFPIFDQFPTTDTW